MRNENKIVVTSCDGKSWEMTPEQIEAAYRYREYQYRIDDAKNQLEWNADWIRYEYGYSYDEAIEYAEELAERFQDDFDCNMSENSIWINCITEMFDSIGKKMFDSVGKKENDDD